MFTPFEFLAARPAPRSGWWGGARALIALVVVVLAAAPATVEASIRVLSSRADTVSGNDALVSIDLPKGAAAVPPQVTVNGVAAASTFRRQGQAWVGLVTGLKPGQNTVTASAGGVMSRLTLVNHSRSGPIFSGPQQTPFICETAQFKLPDGSLLGAALDASCNAPTRVLYLYRSTAGGGFKVLPAGAAPSDVAKTTTLAGRTVNYIVRVEVGTINRAIYQTAVLFDPTLGERADPTQLHPGWNGRAVYVFGGGVTSGYHQGTILGEDNLSDAMLSRGFGVMSSTLSVMGTVGSDVVSAETASMVKERFIETYGAPTYVFGWGGSGGSMQQHLIANNYPGVLDGIVPGTSFPDVYTLTVSEDCALLNRAFGASKTSWTEEQKRAVSGLNNWGTCGLWLRFFSPELMLARQAEPKFPGFKGSNCHLIVPRALTYDRVNNPRGARCDIYSASRNSLGFDPKTGATYRGFDNVGVQYGLEAYRQGAISAEQFVELNERVGGIDNDGEYRSERAVADPVGLRRMFAYGRVNEGGNLGAIPIIDLRPNTKLVPEIHDPVNSEVMRARLIRANGDAENQVIVRGEADPTVPGAGTVSGSPAMDLFALLKMDEWLSNMSKDDRRDTNARAKVLAARPADLKTDVCFLVGGVRVDEASDIRNQGQCGRRLPYFSETRLTAGEPLTRDVLKCRLRPLRKTDLQGLTPAQAERLRAVFPKGVCDYAKPSVGYGPLKGTWITYARPGQGAPMGPEPTGTQTRAARLR
jgi:hypothetical protein